MGSAYDSPDNKEFVAKIEGCCTALQAMADKLRLASDVLKTGAEHVEKTVQHNVDEVKKIGNQGGA